MNSEQKLRIAVICGGNAHEAEVSRESGGAVATALRETYDDVVTLELTRDVARQLWELSANVVFPALHGPPGEDGTLQGVLEMMGIPYVGSGVLASALAMNKEMAKRVFKASGLPLAPDVVIERTEPLSWAMEKTQKALGLSVVVKPSNQGSALGVTFCESADSLERALSIALQFGDRVLVEGRVIGREVTVALLEQKDLVVLPPIEIRTPAGSWYDYEHRYTAGLSEHVIPAPLPQVQYNEVCRIAAEAHRALGCRDLSRVDFVVPAEGSPVLLEINSLPGMTPTSLYPDAARAAGISFSALVAQLVSRALHRGTP